MCWLMSSEENNVGGSEDSESQERLGWMAATVFLL